MNSKERVYALLKELDIPFVRHEHPPVYTVEEAKQYWNDIPGVHCKNLFLRDKKGKNHFLVVMPHDKPLDLKKMASIIGADNLSFASPERLMKHLRLEPGSVTPFGIINDEENNVRVIVDTDLISPGKVNFHPNVNTRTVTISADDFKKFLAYSGNKVQYVAIAGT